MDERDALVHHAYLIGTPDALARDQPGDLVRHDWRPTRLRYGEIVWRGNVARLRPAANLNAPATGPVLVAMAYLFCFAWALASLSCVIALSTGRQEGMAVFVHLVNMPMLFTSTALVPARHMPEWLQAIAAWNPLSLAVDALRDALLFGAWPSIPQDFIALAALAVAMFLLGVACMSHMTAAK